MSFIGVGGVVFPLGADSQVGGVAGTLCVDGVGFPSRGDDYFLNLCRQILSQSVAFVNYYLMITSS